MNLGTDKVLITGGLGWLGSRLREILCCGFPDHPDLLTPLENSHVRCLVLPSDSGRLRPGPANMEVQEGDLEDYRDCERFCRDAQGAVLFHIAGLIHPRRTPDLYRTNVAGTRNLLAAATAAGVRRVIVMSSNSPCGCNPHPDHLFDELSPYRPYLGYGRSKMQMELAVREFQARGDLEAVIVRAPWFYGPHQPRRQTLFFEMVRDGKAPIVGSGENLRSMSYVDNLVQGLLLAAIRDTANGKTYWIADRQPYSMNNIINTIERLLESEFGARCVHKRLRLPGFASDVAFLADAVLQSLGLYHQKIHVLSEMNKTIACSVKKAELELGYQPSVELEEGMRRSLQWCVDNGVRF